MLRALAVAPLVAAACADAGPARPPDARPLADGTPGTADAASPHDAASSAADADPGDCLPYVPQDFGTPTPYDSSQFATDGDYTFIAELAPDGERFQKLFISLHEGEGVFSGPVEPGTYTLEGDETDYQFCGACVYLAVQDDETPSTLYMATAGKLRIDNAGAEVHGELTSASLRQIAIEYRGDSCPGDGEWPCGNTGCSGGQCGIQVEGPECETFVDSLSF